MNGTSSISETDSGILAFHAQQQQGLKENNKMLLDAMLQFATMGVALARDMQEANHRHQILMVKLEAELKGK